MISFTHLLHTGVRTANANAPALLTAFGAVGVVGTAVLTGKASFEAAKRIADAESVSNMKREAGQERVVLTKAEKFKLVWPLYIGAVTSGTLSCGAVIVAHRVSSRRAAALAAAYALSEGRLEEYQDKVKEKFGIKKEKEARDELAQERVNRDVETGGAKLYDPTDNKVWLKDEYSGRYFLGTIEDINKAVNEVNREVLNSMGSAATLSSFYDAIGLEHVSTSDYFGWNTNELCEIDWSTTTTPDGRHAVHVFDFVNPPIMNPDASASFR
jgi:hypothetical protein